MNNIDLSSGQQYLLPTGTVIHLSETEISAVNSNGQAVTVNVDERGVELASTAGYELISETTDDGVVETLDNGNTITTYTTTKVWHKDEVTSPVNEHYVGQVLYTSKGFTSTAEAQAHMLAVSAEWWAYADANVINVDISWAGGNPYYVTIVVSEIY